MSLSSLESTKAKSEYVIAAPEPGQLVEVRRRQWVVSNVSASETAEDLANIQHCVTLSSIDEDALGEQLEVIWEIEPGAHIIEKAGLPSITGQDETKLLEAFLDAVRWGAATNADKGFLQAPFRSGVSIEDFQLDPLVRAIDMARANLLIADDVGLGKTIEAGLVIQELLLRHRARSVLIICPASLQEKWRLEMTDAIDKARLTDRECILLAYGLLWHAPTDRSSWLGLLASEARKAILESIDRADQSRGIELARSVLPSMRPSQPNISPEWDDLDLEDRQ